MKSCLAGLGLWLGLVSAGLAAEFDARVPMTVSGTDTFYVTGSVDGIVEAEFLVDTGSAYTAINKKTLDALKAEGRAQYLKELSGVMADGRRKIVPVYRIASITIAGGCVFTDVEAAVLPGRTRQIIGLSALKQAAPFVFSMEPAELRLSHCGTGES